MAAEFPLASFIGLRPAPKIEYRVAVSRIGKMGSEVSRKLIKQEGWISAHRTLHLNEAQNVSL
jgi:hypothetical protein